jgi:CBS domain-containing protein
MSRKPITIAKEASWEDAAQLMLRAKVSCLPVVSADGGIDGIITWRDLLRAYSQQARRPQPPMPGESSSPDATSEKDSPLNFRSRIA